MSSQAVTITARRQCSCCLTLTLLVNRWHARTQIQWNNTWCHFFIQVKNSDRYKCGQISLIKLPSKCLSRKTASLFHASSSCQSTSYPALKIDNWTSFRVFTDSNACFCSFSCFSILVSNKPRGKQYQTPQRNQPKRRVERARRSHRSQ